MQGIWKPSLGRKTYLESLSEVNIQQYPSPRGHTCQEESKRMLKTNKTINPGHAILSIRPAIHWLYDVARRREQMLPGQSSLHCPVRQIRHRGPPKNRAGGSANRF
jgi:hypothetical protein